MGSKPALHIGVCAAILGSSLGFVLPALQPVRVLWYYPLARHWSFEATPTAMAMDWYGRSLLAFLIGIAAFAVSYGIARLFRAIPHRTLHLFTAWAATATVLAGAIYGSQIAMRRPAPEPLPSWYVPK